MNKITKEQIFSGLIQFLSVVMIILVPLIYSTKNGASEMELLLVYAFAIVAFLIATFLQIMIHEAGHLVFGLASGYGFNSFRIGSLMLQKTNEGLKWKRLNIAGTAGQCLMTPPSTDETYQYPYKLYHLGGIMMNGIVSLPALLIAYIFKNNTYVFTFFFALAIYGITLILVNGIPMKIGQVANDGYNVISLGKEKAAMRAVWTSLWINAYSTNGIRLKDMPKEWFEHIDGDSHNSLVLSHRVLKANRDFDARLYAKAKEEITTLLENKDLIGLYRNLLLIDSLTIDLMEKGKEADISVLDEPSMKAVLKQMKNYPAILRMQYALAKLYDEDEAKATKIKEQFEKIKHSYPSEGDIVAEIELMEDIEKMG